MANMDDRGGHGIISVSTRGDGPGSSKRRHLSARRRQVSSNEETDSYDEEYTVSDTGSEKRIHSSPRRKRRNSNFDRRHHSRKQYYSRNNGPLSYCFLLLGRTIKTLVILPLAEILGWVQFYILSTVIVVFLVFFTITSLPSLVPKLLTFLLPRMIYLPSVLQRGIQEVSHFPTALGNTYCSTIGIGCSRFDKQIIAEEMIGNVTYSATSQVRQASKVITSLNNLDSTSNSLALDSVSPLSLTPVRFDFNDHDTNLRRSKSTVLATRQSSSPTSPTAK